MISSDVQPGAARSEVERAELAVAARARHAGDHLPRVVILNQYYVPDVASTGQLLHELAENLAVQGFDVQVITAHPSYGPPETWKKCASREKLDDVDVRRMWTTRFSKDRMIGRAINFATYVIPLQLRMLFGSRSKDVHLYTTNPPFLGAIGAVVSMVRKHPYVVLLHDAHPQLSVWVGKVKGTSPVVKLWQRINGITYRRAAQAICLCHSAKKLICETYGVDPSKVHVIPNWADGQKLFPIEKSECKFAKKHSLDKPFTILYSGNLGLYYEFETLLDAAELLKGENVRFVFVGSGGRKGWLAEQIKARNLSNSMVLPYVPIEELNDSLNSCDMSVVSIAKGIEGISFPSKLYSSLAVGKPVLAISEAHSELRQIIEEPGVGKWIELGDKQGLVNLIRELSKDRASCEKMGAQARKLFEMKYTKEITCGQYADVLKLADPKNAK
jgi:glycosyltransferase involved in cell wall biosynthesis